jgi:hypothetical protein
MHTGLSSPQEPVVLDVPASIVTTTVTAFDSSASPGSGDSSASSYSGSLNEGSIMGRQIVMMLCSMLHNSFPRSVLLYIGGPAHKMSMQTIFLFLIYLSFICFVGRVWGWGVVFFCRKLSEMSKNEPTVVRHEFVFVLPSIEFYMHLIYGWQSRKLYAWI